MSLRYGVLCLLLLFVVLLLFSKNYETWTSPAKFIPGKEAAKKSAIKIEGPPLVTGQKNPTTAEAYIFIAEKNIFTPERKDFPIVKSSSAAADAASRKPPVRPKVVLYGVTIQGNYQVASISNPGRTLQKGERETFTAKLGDRIGEYKLAKISADRISLEAEGDSFEILLYDSKVPKKRMDIRTETKPATVTSTQPVPAGPQPGATLPVAAPPPGQLVRPAPSKDTIAPAPASTKPPAPLPPRPVRGRTMSNPQTGAPTQAPGPN
jgi:hypothetical protein